MARTPVNWNPNRYGSVKHVLKFDATTGTYSLQEQEQNYNNTYNFTSLPSGNTQTQTSTNTTTQQTGTTTQQQTTEAFGNVKPHYWDVEDKDDKSGANVFQWNEKSSQTEEDITAKEYREYSQDSNLLARFPTFEEYQKSLHPFKSRIESITAPFKKQAKKAWDWAKPLAIRAVDAVSEKLRPTILGSSANQSYRGISGLYNKEIGLMDTYGSTMPTDGNPQGDPRKDDAGFNIVSFAGNYNMIGTYSRRHNMLKVADNIINPTEKKKARNKIRDDWENEKKTGIVNKDYNIDASGSKPTAPTNVVNPTHHRSFRIDDRQTKTTAPKSTHQFNPDQGGQFRGGNYGREPGTPGGWGPGVK